MFKNITASLLLLLLLSACAQQSKKDATSQTADESLVYDLDESTAIIQQLIQTQELSKILVEANKESLDILIKNFSPAEMAFEAEVLNYEGPVILYFYQVTHAKTSAWLEELASIHKNLKFVVVPHEKLFRITEKCEVDFFPTFMIIENRKEKDRLEEPINTKETLINFINQTLILSSKK